MLSIKTFALIEDIGRLQEEEYRIPFDFSNFDGTFNYEISWKPPWKTYVTNKSDVYDFDNTWSLHLLDLHVYRPEKNRGYRYVLK